MNKPTLVRCDVGDPRSIVWVNPAHVAKVEVHWDEVGICRVYIRVVNEPGLIIVPTESIAEREKLLHALGVRP